MMRRFVRTCLRDVGLLLGLTILAGAVTKAAHPGAPAWFVHVELDEFAVSRDEVRSKWSDQVLWIDARSAEAFDLGHQPGALRLAPTEWNELLPDLFDQITSASRPIVVYCDGAKCGKSKEIAEKLREVGVVDVYHLIGGWSAMTAK